MEMIGGLKMKVCSDALVQYKWNSDPTILWFQVKSLLDELYSRVAVPFNNTYSSEHILIFRVQSFLSLQNEDMYIVA